MAADLPVPVGDSMITWEEDLRALVMWSAIWRWGGITFGKGHPILIPLQKKLVRLSCSMSPWILPRRGGPGRDPSADFEGSGD